MEHTESEKAPSTLLPTLRNRLGLNETLAQQRLSSLPIVFEDADWHNRVEAVLASADYPEPISMELLLKALHDEDVSVRAAAMHALGKRTGGISLSLLVEAMRDSEWLVREAAVLTLGKLSEPGTSREQLMDALDDENEFVRDAAMWVLQQAHAASPIASPPGSPGVLYAQEQCVQTSPLESEPSKGQDHLQQEVPAMSNADLESAEAQKPTLRQLSPTLAKSKRRPLQRVGEGVLAALLIAGLLVSWLLLAQKLHPSTAHNGATSTGNHFHVSALTTVTPHLLNGQGKIVLTYRAQGGLEYPTWSANGKHLLFVSDSGDGQHGGGTVYSWDVTTRKLTKTFTLPTLTNAAGGYAWSPDGTRIILASYDGKLQLFNALTGQRILGAESPSAFEDWPNFDWSPDNRYLALTGADGTLQIWDAMTGKRFAAFPEHLKGVYWISWSPDGQRIVTIIAYGLVQVWDTATGKKISTINDPRLVDEQWSSDSHYLVSRNNDGSLTVWDALTGRKVSSHRGDVAQWLCNDTRLLSTDSHVIDIWNATTGKTLFTLPEPAPLNMLANSGYMPPSRWALSPDCKLLALSSVYTDVQVVDATTDHLITTINSPAAIGGIYWSSDGRYVGATTNDRRMLIWNAVTRKTLSSYHLTSNAVYSVGWSPDDSFIFTVSVDHVLQILQTS